MVNKDLVESLNSGLGISIPSGYSYESIHGALSAYINGLINSDFEKLVTLLYRIDVHEQKLKALLQEHPEEKAGDIIATLIIERESQKIRSREQFSSRDENIDDAEKW